MRPMAIMERVCDHEFEQKSVCSYCISSTPDAPEPIPPAPEVIFVISNTPQQANVQAKMEWPRWVILRPILVAIYLV